MGKRLLVALVVALCAPAMAQLSTAKDAPFVSLDSSVPVENFATSSSASRLSSGESSAARSSSSKSTTGLSSLPPDAQGPLSAALGKDDSGYWIQRNTEGLRGENPQHALVVEFTRQGAEVRSHNLRCGLETRGYGYGDALHPVEAVAPQANGNRVEYRRNGVTEWYENGPLGLEQGFTLAHPPGKANGRALTLELALHGDLIAAIESGGKALELKRKDGEAALRYTGLQARDATGRDLRSWLEVRGERLLLRVDDGGARYPVLVDPWVQQAELTASDGAYGDFFGYSLAVSGSTLVVGAPNHMVGSNQRQGAAYVFVESGGTWSQQAELTASDGQAWDSFGISVAVSGSTAVVGASGGDKYQLSGVAYVFVESGGTWSQQWELTASDGAPQDYFGGSVAVDGSTAVVGAPYHTVGSNSRQGAAYIFVKSGGKWSQQAELTASDGAAHDYLGISVAISGSTVAAGAPYHTVGLNYYQGAAYMFVESGGTWSQQAELTSSDGAANDNFGISVALSGGTAVVGANGHALGYYQGAAYVFVESGGTWSQQAELTASDGAQGDGFGASVALSGSTAVAGAPGHTVGSNFRQGAAYVFVEGGGTWSQQAELTASDGAEGDSFGGNSVAVSSSAAVVGAPGHAVGSNNAQGAAYVFGSSGPALTLSSTSLNFGDVVLNRNSAPQTISATNTGSTTLDISSIAISGDFTISTNTCGATLDVGTSCSVSVTFTPKALGTRTGTLTFTDNAPDSPQTVSLSGTGVKKLPVTLTPASATYPKQKVGTTSKPKTFTLKNTQKVTLTNIAISTTGDFAVSATTCGASLMAKSKCTISVTFTPTQTGTRAGQLSVSDSAGNSPQTSSLKGTGK